MGKSKKTPARKTVRFEQAIDQLESLIDQIESGEIGLEDALKQYEKGMALIKQCRQILTAAEKRIAELTVEGGRLHGPDSERDDT